MFRGRVYPPGRDTSDRNSIYRVVISPNFFDVMGIPIVLGRAPTERDTAEAPKVVVINETAARRFFPNENPVGRHFGTSVETAGALEIVGDCTTRGTTASGIRRRRRCMPYMQAQPGNATFEVRTAGNPTAAMGAVRDAARRIDTQQPAR